MTPAGVIFNKSATPSVVVPFYQLEFPSISSNPNLPKFPEEFWNKIDAPFAVVLDNVNILYVVPLTVRFWVKFVSCVELPAKAAAPRLVLAPAAVVEPVPPYNKANVPAFKLLAFL